MRRSIRLYAPFLVLYLTERESHWRWVVTGVLNWDSSTNDLDRMPSLLSLCLTQFNSATNATRIGLADSSLTLALTKRPWACWGAKRHTGTMIHLRLHCDLLQHTSPPVIPLCTLLLDFCSSSTMILSLGLCADFYAWYLCACDQNVASNPSMR